MTSPAASRDTSATATKTCGITNNQVDFSDLTWYPSLARRGGCTVMRADGSRQTITTNASNEVINVHAHSLLAGFAARPTDRLRTSFDLELVSADNAPTRGSPRNLQHYKGRASDKPKHWLDLSGTVNVLESRKNVPEILHREHSRNYGFATTPESPSALWPRVWLQLRRRVFHHQHLLRHHPGSDELHSVQRRSAILVGGVVLYQQSPLRLRQHHVQTGATVTANVGYNLTSTNGFTPTLADPAILTSLGFNYHKPTAELDVNLVKGLTWKTAWGYYDYNEKFLPASLRARDFQANTATLSLRYEF